MYMSKKTGEDMFVRTSSGQRQRLRQKQEIGQRRTLGQGLRLGQGQGQRIEELQRQS